MRSIYTTFFALLLVVKAMAATNDSIRHWGYGLSVSPSKTIVMDSWQKEWQKDKNNFSIDATVMRQWLPSDSSAYARDYNFPSLSISAKYAFNHGVTMHRPAKPKRRRGGEADYDSRLGNSLSLYATFTRTIYRNRKFDFDYSLSFGGAYSKTKYNPYDNIDNELVGSHLSIHFGAGVHATYHPVPDWGIRVGAEYWHISNGAMARPNKGANFFGPSVGVVFTPYYESLLKKETAAKEKFHPYFFANVAFAVGAKTLHEDWNKSYYSSTPDNELYYRTDFPVYATLAWQVDGMYRYARRWASGVGVDLFYGHYAKRVAEMEGPTSKYRHSPWSVGVAAKHEVYFGNLVCQIGIGYYLHREMGRFAKDVEKPYYERVGVSYCFDKLGGMRLGFNIKAHFTKADYTELLLTMPIRLSKK
ncbi:MAG: acyloxyacyl hydrolase [Prevotella sp.]|nr:acyloxyacyl hydrolase [Prevotella sp.]